MPDPEKQQSGVGVIAVCTLVLAVLGCSTPLRVDSDFPRPLVATLPIGAGVFYDDSLRQYVFEKDADATSLEWKIELGSAHVQLFDRLFQSVFEKLVHLENLTAGNDSGRLGVVMRPSIDAYSLHTPGETTSDFYEVEIRYRLDFHSPAGDLIRHWSYAGRGKCRAALFSNDESVRKATVAAMRDAAAWLVVELTQYPDFHALLHAQQNDPENAVDDQDS